MRLLEDEVRADSITSCAPGPSLTTQASNFSFFRRSAASPLSATLSMPNCRKHSASVLRKGSLMSTRATRAEAFLFESAGITRVPKALSIDEIILASIYSVLLYRHWQRRRRPIHEY